MKDVETLAICEEVLPNTQITEAAMKSQVQKDKGKRKEGTDVERKHIIMTRKRRKLILPDTSPYSEIDVRSKKLFTKAMPKASKFKFHKKRNLRPKL